MQEVSSSFQNLVPKAPGRGVGQSWGHCMAYSLAGASDVRCRGRRCSGRASLARGAAVMRRYLASACNRCVFPFSPSLPALDWQLPSRSGPYELRIEVQPKPHHRAHYETEGSRGAVKASAGGHPSVQVLASPGSIPIVGARVFSCSCQQLARRLS